jgi:hypothetical protein
MPRLSLARIVALGSLLLAAFHLACGGQQMTSASVGISRIAPQHGSTFGGNQVSIFGCCFVSGTSYSVRIDDAAVAGTLVSGTEIHVTMPAHAVGSVDLTVATSSGASDTLRQGYTYDIFGATSVVPAAGIPEGGDIVSIIGTGFDFSRSVTFGGVAADGYLGGLGDSDTLLLVSTPAHVAGAVDVVVIYSNGQQSRIVNGYTYAPSEAFGFSRAWSASHTLSPAVPVIKGQ